jgi:spermidine/putrescine-binding protein
MKHKEIVEAIRNGKMSRRQLMSVLASVGVGVTAVGMMSRGASAASTDMKLLEWNGYEAPAFHPEYAAKYGGEPDVTFFSETEDAFQKMKAGFDANLVHPCTGEVAKFKDAGLIKPLDLSRIPRWNEIIPSLLEVKGVRFGDQYYFAPWDWFYSRVAYNPDFIKEDNPSFDLFIDPKYKGKTALNSQIGVNILIAGVIGKWAKPLDPTEEEMKMAPEIFTKMLQNARFIWNNSTDLNQAWAAGDVQISYVWGGTVKTMKEQGIGLEIVKPVMPWMCGLCVSSSSEGVREEMAYDYINAMLDPVGGRAFFDAFGYGHANIKSLEGVDPAILKEKGLDDPVALLNSGVFFDEVPPAKDAKLTEMWHEAQAGLD